MNFEMLLCIRLCALRFVLVCALTFVLSDVCSHVLSYVLPYALICVLSFVLVNLHSHICALVCILSYLCSHLCAPSFLPRDAMFHLFLFTLFGVPCRCNLNPRNSYRKNPLVRSTVWGKNAYIYTSMHACVRACIQTGRAVHIYTY